MTWGSRVQSVRISGFVAPAQRSRIKNFLEEVSSKTATNGLVAQRFGHLDFYEFVPGVPIHTERGGLDFRRAKFKSINISAAAFVFSKQ